MGARCVVAPGRNAAVLDDLRQRFGERLVPVRLTGDAAADTLATILVGWPIIWLTVDLAHRRLPAFEGPRALHLPKGALGCSQVRGRSGGRPVPRSAPRRSSSSGARAGWPSS
jgi:hypothetical protein